MEHAGGRGGVEYRRLCGPARSQSPARAVLICWTPLLALVGVSIGRGERVSAAWAACTHRDEVGQRWLGQGVLLVLHGRRLAGPAGRVHSQGFGDRVATGL